MKLLYLYVPVYVPFLFVRKHIYAKKTNFG